jgi:lipoate synthase
MLRWRLEVVYVDVNRINCWSCDGPGVRIGGHSWLRRCVPCDVEWDAQPPGSADERARMWQRGNTLDTLAAKYGLGNRDGFVDHGAVKLPSVA